MDLDEYRRRKAAVIYQDFALFPLLTALENIEYPMELCRGGPEGAPGRELARRVSCRTSCWTGIPPTSAAVSSSVWPSPGA